MRSSVAKCGAVNPGLAFRVWASLAGLALWVPAWSPVLWALPVQSMDLLVLAGWPFILVHARRCVIYAPRVLIPCGITIGLSWLVSGGEVLVLMWIVFFALPFVALITLVLTDHSLCEAFLKGFYIAAILSVIFFMVQIWYGAEDLDFRSNFAFRLPPQFDRGFALFPEVSTFAVHTAIAAAMGLSVLLHPLSTERARKCAFLFLLLTCFSLLFSRSTSVLSLAPFLLILSLVLTTRLTVNGALMLVGLAALLGGFLVMYVEYFYVDRIVVGSAYGSFSIRLVSILAGLSPLVTGDMFGLGLGESAQVPLRAHQVARSWGLRIGSLPDGINSHIIKRIFEEGWPALCQMALALYLLIRGRGVVQISPAMAGLYVLAIGACLSALLVTGYRGLYLNWFWLAAAAAWAAKEHQPPRGDFA